MRVIIAGSRHYEDIEHVRQAMRECEFDVDVVISGAARGVDRLGEQWAAENGIKVQQFYADWYKHERRAGMIRNAAMAGCADALVAIWDGESRGTRHMINTMRRLGKRVYVYYADDPL